MIGFLKKLFTPAGDNGLAAAIEQGAFLVDVRTPGEFASGSVQGAVNIPLDKISSQLAKFRNKQSIIVFCRSGMRSSQAKSILERNGIQNVTNGGSISNIYRALTKPS